MGLILNSNAEIFFSAFFSLPILCLQLEIRPRP